MAATFEQVWRRVRTYAPNAPALLVRSWVQDAYSDLCDRRPWAFLRADVQLTIAPSVSVAVTVTQDSATVTSVGLFTLAMVGRQIRLSALYPPFTILTRPDANTITVDRPYPGANGSLTATVQDVFVTLPEDFGQFLSLASSTTQRPIPWWISEDELNAYDPARTQAGPVRVLAASRLSAAGRVRFEAWPYSSGGDTLTGLYKRRPTPLSDPSEFLGVLADRDDLLELGARIEAARFPGTTDNPNPYFNLQLARLLSEDYEKGLLTISLRDDDEYPMGWSVLLHERTGLLALSGDDHSLRSSDASIADYAYGAFGY